jgi:hypothetical protein
MKNHVAYRFTAATSEGEENGDAPLLNGAPPITSGGLYCVDHGLSMPHGRTLCKA